MATNIQEEKVEIKDFSLGTQRATTKFVGKLTQQELGINADYSRVGGVQKISGYSQLGNTITTSSTSSTTSSTSSSTSTSTSTSSSTSTSTSTSSTTTP